MVSWREELARREAEAAEQAARMRGQIAELTEQLNAVERTAVRMPAVPEPDSKALEPYLRAWKARASRTIWDM